MFSLTAHLSFFLSLYVCVYVCVCLCIRLHAHDGKKISREPFKFQGVVRSKGSGARERWKDYTRRGGVWGMPGREWKEGGCVV